jgi:FAD/FMN-containing dehydrogenase
MSGTAFLPLGTRRAPGAPRGGPAVDSYPERVARIQQALRGAAAGPLGLAKHSSNLFRERAGLAKQRLDLGELTHVLAVDTAAGCVDAEGLVSYEALVDATLPHGVMPAVVPQLKTITVGGALAGVGIEATSFRAGLVHDTLLEADVLLGSGELVTCRPDNEHRDLFLALPNSYGTLGYVTRARLRTRPVQPFVHVQHRRFGSPQAFFTALEAAWSEPGVDFLDGVVFGQADLVLNVARFVAQPAGPPSDYTFEHIYHRSLREKFDDTLSARGWLWRWDTDWFWCSRRFGAERPWVRRLLGPARLNSRSYTTWMRRAAALGLGERWARLRGATHVESVIQDVELPLEHAGEFLRFLFDEIGIVPIWICPLREAEAALPFTLYPLAPHTRYVNFGFWDTLQRRGDGGRALGAGHFNRLVEQRVLALGGIKSLYSDVYLGREQFARAYRLDRYEVLKARYDPGHRFFGLYEKCVLRA